MLRRGGAGEPQDFLLLSEKKEIPTHHHNDDEVLPEIEEQFEKLFEEIVHNDTKVRIPEKICFGIIFRNNSRHVMH